MWLMMRMMAMVVMAAAGLAPQTRGGNAVGITVYDNPDFRGRSATFRTDTPDLRPFGLTDKVTSLTVAPGEAWEVCEHINYEGRCRVFTSSQRDLRDIGFNDLISSVRRVRDAGRGLPPGRGGEESGRGRGPAIPRARLQLFDQRDYRGRSITIDEASPTLRGFSNRAGSARVLSGSWEICERTEFGGRCMIVTRSIPDLRRIGLNDQLSSARPVR